MSCENEKVSYKIIFWEFFKIGLSTVGGGLVMLPIISEMAVQERKWLSYDDMSKCIAIGQSVPGVISINVSSAVGYKVRGKKGAVVASLGIMLPSLLILSIFYGILDKLASNQIVVGAMRGIRIGLIGVLLSVIYTLSKKTFSMAFHYISFTITIIMLCVLKLAALSTLLLWGVIGMIYFYFKDRKRGS